MQLTFPSITIPTQHTIRQLHFRNISNEFRFSIIFLLFFSYTPYIAILFSSFYFRFRIFSCVGFYIPYVHNVIIHIAESYGTSEKQSKRIRK